MLNLPSFIENNNLAVTPPLPKKTLNRKRNQSECILRERKLSESTSCRQRNFSECSSRSEAEKAEQAANSRLRVGKIAEGFRKLADCVPAHPRKGNQLSQLETLKSAIDYIKELNRTLNESLLEEEFGNESIEYEQIFSVSQQLNLPQQLNLLQKFNASNETPINRQTPPEQRQHRIAPEVQISPENYYSEQHTPYQDKENDVPLFDDLLPSIEPNTGGLDFSQHINVSPSQKQDEVASMDTSIAQSKETKSKMMSSKKRKTSDDKQSPLQKRKKTSISPRSSTTMSQTLSSTIHHSRPPTYEIHGALSSVFHNSRKRVYKQTTKEGFLSTIERDFPKLSHSISNIIKTQESRRDHVPPEIRQSKQISAEVSAFRSFKKFKQHEKPAHPHGLPIMQVPVQYPINEVQKPSKRVLQASIRVPPPVHTSQPPPVHTSQPPPMYFPQVHDWREEYIKKWRQSFFNDMAKSREMCF